MHDNHRKQRSSFWAGGWSSTHSDLPVRLRRRPTYKAISGRFRGANFPLRRTAEGPFLPDFRAVIETVDGATIMVWLQGYGRAHPPGRRQIVGSVFHLSDSDRYRRLNDVVCVCVGEVRAPVDPDRQSSDLVIDVAELVWEPISQ